jgi:hypothetical protein
MLNYYQVLGVPHDANDRVIKIAYEGKLKALAKAELSETERRNEERLLEQAYATLSSDAKRSWHDKQLALEDQHAVDAARARNRMGWFAAAVMALLLVGGSSYYAVQRIDDRERLRLEELRIVNAKAKEDARIAADEERLAQEKSSFQYRQERDASRQYSSDRSYFDRQSRYNRDSAFQDQVRSRTLNTWDTYMQQQEEDRNRNLSDADRRKAWQEVERQKRFVEEREREDERIRSDRYYRVQREMELARNREATEASAYDPSIGPLPPRKRPGVR